MCLVGQLSVLVGNWPMADRYIVLCWGLAIMFMYGMYYLHNMYVECLSM